MEGNPLHKVLTTPCYFLKYNFDIAVTIAQMQASGLSRKYYSSLHMVLIIVIFNDWRNFPVLIFQQISPC